jgi:hypothetical protein
MSKCYKSFVRIRNWVCDLSSCPLYGGAICWVAGELETVSLCAKDTQTSHLVGCGWPFLKGQDLVLGPYISLFRKPPACSCMVGARRKPEPGRGPVILEFRGPLWQGLTLCHWAKENVPSIQLQCYRAEQSMSRHPSTHTGLMSW